MIKRSDNTAADMPFKVVGAESVPEFIASAGLQNTPVPDSTRALTGYLFSARNYKTLTWKQLLCVIKGRIVKPFLNDVETFA